jgi:hypothetical protein
METLQDRSSASGDGPPAEPNQRGKLGRIAGHTRGLVDDLREWIDLRLDLALLEVEEQVDTLRNEVALGITLAFLGFFAALFVLTTAALGLGWLLGHPFWGFLIVTVVLLVAVAVLARTRPDLLPPSHLFERIRGRTEAAEDDARPVRDASASVSDSESATDATER